MTEISKQFKIMLVINIVISLAYAIPYMFISGPWLALTEHTASSPFYSQVFGVALFGISVWCLRAILQKKEWEAISYFVEFVFVFLFGILIYLLLEIWFVINKVVTPVAWINAIISMAVVSALIVANIIFYFLETAKHQ
ncbi:MAG: hypothetical protein ACTSRE_14380 [Promethearchaeota archaeon]